MIEALALIADGRLMGEVRRDRRGRLTLAYDPAWRDLPGAWPLSLSMPLVVAEHEHARIDPWLRRLLPDNDAVLERWGQRFHTVPRDAFALLAAVGEDCAGAVQFVRPDRAPSILDGKPTTVEWLTRTDLAERLRSLRKDAGAWRTARDGGQCSLGGTRPKTALFFNGQHWGVPSGRTPTTHIVKPALVAQEGRAHNEHLCLTLARALGLPTARTQVLRIEDQLTLAIERYDRVRDGAAVRRLHQEDLQQALGAVGTKNGRNGRPIAVRMIETVRAYSGAPVEDAWSLARALMFRWLIAGDDRPAAGTSMLIGAGGRARLAPLYGLTSTLADARAGPPTPSDVAVADTADAGQWSRFATAARLPVAQLVAACRDMARALPEALPEVATQVRSEAGDHPVVGRLVEQLRARAEYCAQALAA